MVRCRRAAPGAKAGRRERNAIGKMKFPNPRALRTQFATRLRRNGRMPELPDDQPPPEAPEKRARGRVDWLRLIRLLTQYIVPALIAIVALTEIVGSLAGL